jgi:hypothetical protein
MIPALEENAYGDVPSIEKDLKDLKIELANKSEYVDFFSNIHIPKGWRKRTGLPRNKGEIGSRKLHWLRAEECHQLKPGDVWFCGTVLEFAEGKYGDYLKLRLKDYMGQILASTEILAAFPLVLLPDLYEMRTNLTGKIIAIAVINTYIENESLDLRLEIMDR